MNDALDTIIGDLRAYIAQLRAQLAQAEQRALAAEAVIARAATHLPGRPKPARAA